MRNDQDGHGFVLVEFPEKHGLQPGIPTELGIDRYSISMFHQLHCLVSLQGNKKAMEVGPQKLTNTSLAV